MIANNNWLAGLGYHRIGTSYPHVNEYSCTEAVSIPFAVPPSPVALNHLKACLRIICKSFFESPHALLCRVTQSILGSSPTAVRLLHISSLGRLCEHILSATGLHFVWKRSLPSPFSPCMWTMLLYSTKFSGSVVGIKCGRNAERGR